MSLKKLKKHYKLLKNIAIHNLVILTNAKLQG